MISIIIPVYNGRKYLRRCVDSILAQTYKDFEIILVDDGSSDGSSAICDDYAAKHSDVSVIHKENEGLQAARISGINLAKGEYIGFVDADDWIEPKMYEALISSIGNSDLVTSGYVRNGADKEIVFSATDALKPGTYIVNDQPFIDEWFFSENYDGYSFTSGALINSLWTKLFRTDLVRQTFPSANIGISCCEDYLSLTHYLLKCKTVTVTDKCFYHYCINDESMTNSKGGRIIIDQGKLYNSVVAALKGHPYEKKLIRQFQKRFVYEFTPMMIEQLGIDNDLRFPKYRYPSYDDIYKKKVILFGAGNVGRDYYADWASNDLLEIVVWVDSNRAGTMELGRVIESPDEILKKDFDVIICAVLNESVFRSIKEQLIVLGVPENKILWRKPVDFFFEYYKRL